MVLCRVCGGLERFLASFCGVMGIPGIFVGL